MTLLIFLIVSTGLIWALVAVLFSRIPASAEKYAAFMFLETFVYTAGAAAANRPGMFSPTEFLKLAAIFVPSALISFGGFFAMRKAMNCGSSGIAWCAGQASLICPFIVGVLFLGSRKSAWQFIGVAILVVGLVLLARVRQEGIRTDAPDCGRKKFLFRVTAAFLLIGTAQALTLLPGSIIPFSEAALRWRVPLTAAVGFCWILRVKRLFLRELWKKTLVYGIVIAAGNVLFYKSLDAAIPLHLPAIVYPACLGLSVVLFFLYCGIVRREKLGMAGWSAAACAGAGIFLQMF